MIDWVVSLSLQTIFWATEEVNVTELPTQKVVGPLAEIVGTAGVGSTTTSKGKEVAEQPAPLVTVTVYISAMVTTIEFALMFPGFQTLPVALLLNKVMLPPSQKGLLPKAVITGVAGLWST